MWLPILSSRDSRFDEAGDADNELSFLGKLDSGSLKIKVASSIVAISSIHLLQVFLNADKYDDGKMMWLTLMHLTFVTSAVMLGFLEKLMSVTSKNDEGRELTGQPSARLQFAKPAAGAISTAF